MLTVVDGRDVERRARAEARLARTVLRKGVVGEREYDFSPVRGEAAVSLVERLTLEGWTEAGFELPTYSRSETVYRFAPRPHR
jgi:hypothetical protein